MTTALYTLILEASACIPVASTTLCTITAGVDVEVRSSPLS